MTTQFTTNGVNVNGTSLQGYITCSYDTLVEVFGEPNGSGDGYKVQAEWLGKSGDTVFTIYDWKEHQDIYDVTDWHIGGTGHSAVEVVHNIVRERLGDTAKYAVRFDQLRWYWA